MSMLLGSTRVDGFWRQTATGGHRAWDTGQALLTSMLLAALEHTVPPGKEQQVGATVAAQVQTGSDTGSQG